MTEDNKEQQDLRNAILDDSNTDASITENNSASDTTTFQPFNYEKEEDAAQSSSTKQQASKLKEGDVIKISKSKLAEMGIDPQALLKNLHTETSGDDYTKEKIVEDKDRITLSRESSVGMQYLESQRNADTTPYLVDLNKVTVTDAEKEQFLRCTLASKPYIVDVDLHKGSMAFKFKPKTLGLQKTSLSMLSWLMKQYDEKGNPKFDYSATFLWILKSEIILTLISFNGNNPFKFYSKYTDDKSLTESQLFELLKDDMEIIDKLPVPVWNAMINASRVHEQKEKLLNEFLINEDF